VLERDAETIIELERSTMIAMKDELEHGSFEATVKRHFSVATARKLMAIAKHSIISNRSLAHDLPPGWAILYELTKLPDDAFRRALKDGTIIMKRG
jgi:hypothetical protein